jgi:hypothetical protein
LYPSIWTQDYNKYLEHKNSIINQIKDYMENYDKFLPTLKNQVKKLDTDFFSGKELYQTIQESI